MSGCFTRRRGMGMVVLAEAFVVHPVRGGVGDRTANVIESILRRTGCSTLAVNWAKNGLDPSLCLHVFPANRYKIQSRRADSNRLPLLQLRVMIHALQGFARGCKCRIDKPVSLLCLALCCTVLRSRWYQALPCLSERRYVRLPNLSSHISGFGNIHPKVWLLLRNQCSSVSCVK